MNADNVGSVGRFPRSTIWILILAGAVALVFYGISIARSTFALATHIRRQGCESIMSQMEQALGQYRRDHGAYPPAIDSLNDGKNAKGTIYFDYRVNGERRPIRDPWDRPFVYRIPTAPEGTAATHPGFRPKLGIEFYSIGPNGIDDCGQDDDVTAGN